MNERQITPGPWLACCTSKDAPEPHHIFGNNDSMGAIFTVRHNDPTRADFCKDYEIVTIAEAKANAMLAAASPDLLAACEAALAYDKAIHRRADDGGVVMNPCGAIAEGADLDALYDAWISAARAAIAKAKGGAA